MRFHPLNILHIYLISCPIIILSSPMIQKGILLRGPNWPYTCFRFYDIILENLVTLIWELTTLVSHFSYFCYLYCVLNYLIQLSDIISENQVGNPDVGASCRDQTFFEFLSHLYYILQYFIQLSDIISENLVGNPDLGASCPDQTFLLCCNCSSASTVPSHKQPASSSSSSGFKEDYS